ncbi:CheD [Halanaerobium praevalens DSM 2228]|uniref:Probable chemoreceptor glutamine deamidase CheD n=1 Tax=Halanaerobium praevalens (strain ATCC 33744 / DSM 2228 / GSL) TaxID=572479 RepID=E3DPL7_HALPG|nr:CheD [Halanaerobium praevalens DSM 2228]
MPNRDQVAEKLIVKMADHAVGDKNTLLATLGLGSCIGIALYDRFAKVGGLVHIMLPENPGGKKIVKYADTGIPYLIEEMEAIGAKKRRLSAKIVGGAGMFKSESGDSVMKIGARNIVAVKETLKDLGIKILGSDVGKDYGRSMYFYVNDGRVEIKSFSKDLITL